MDRELEKQLIDSAIKDGDIIVKCCVTGLVKVPGTYQFVIYDFKTPYDNISHGYCPSEYEKMMEQIRNIPQLEKKYK